MKRSVVIFVVDGADIPVATLSSNGPIFPIRDISPLDEPRAVAKRLGEEKFGPGFSLVERLGSFELQDRALIVFEGRAMRFDDRHITVGSDESVSSPQIELILSLLSERLLKPAA